jgi:hypothetical protein
MARNSDDLAHVLLHVDEGNMAQVLAVGLVQRSSGKKDSNEIAAHQRLRRLCELGAAIRQAKSRGIEDPPKLPPFHGSGSG